MYNSLQQREVFHLEFLRWFGRKADPKQYALKGGVNMRFFFGSIRYSEDMDLDLSKVRADIIQDIVLNIFNTQVFVDNLRPYGIQRVSIPDMKKAKQTETTQRFKIHLATFSGEDLFTKVEFSRRSLKDGIEVNAIPDSILRTYKLIPVIVPHYNAVSSSIQKITALASRPAVQARDIFDLYILSPKISNSKISGSKIPKKDKLEKAYENLFSVTFEQFRDSVVLFLPSDEQASYDSSLFWDEIKLKVANLLEEMINKHG
ncbi:MAG: nucleotidyl transferase AbiEii/AbiGii toxin family protein [Actinobacteria bacterium]|nr:nucleotidyl transferase AbiEii/AbiGii toxin family protein [Actinomycetota bacterium]MBL7123807.1 nucleotidyl transferase AbiEii/AbiGii toxin family protein [Actinomycetota bacterium]